MRNFKNGDGGSVAIIFAFALIPVVLMVGAAVDYSRALAMREPLQVAVDAAALAAVSDVKLSTSEQEMEDNARMYFEANIQTNLTDAQRAMLSGYDIDLVVDQSTGTRQATVSFNAAIATSFMQVAGITSLDVSGVARAEAGTSKYIDFHVFVDLSDSMGLAADEAARTVLKAKSPTVLASKETCEFACHVKQASKDTETLLQTARKNNVKLRVDVAKEGIGVLLDEATAAIDETATVSRFSISGFNGQTWPIGGLSENHSTVRTAVGKLELGYGVTSYANTWFDVSAPTFLTSIKALDAAATDRSASKVVVLVTDGLQSQMGGSGTTNGKKQIRPFDLDQCTAIKNAGYSLAVVYTRYYDIPYNGWYNTYVKPIRESLETNLRACASKDLFAVGDTPAEIHDAFAQIFNNAKSLTHLTH